MLSMKEYDLAFSLGSSCGVSQALRAAGLQFASYPLDWLGSRDVRRVAKVVAGNFEKLFGDLYIGQHGYCDFFLLPNLTHYQSKHSYILEIKYLPKKDFDAKAEQQWQEAVTQIEDYASAPRVEALRQGTTLHRIVMQFCGWELARMEEV